MCLIACCSVRSKGAEQHAMFLREDLTDPCLSPQQLQVIRFRQFFNPIHIEDQVIPAGKLCDYRPDQLLAWQFHKTVLYTDIVTIPYLTLFVNIR